MSESALPPGAAETVRQEIEVRLGGKTYLCRPDFETLGNIEAQMGQPCRTLGLKALVAMMPVANRQGAAEISLTEMAGVLFWMLRGKKGAPASIKDIGDMLMDEGTAGLLSPVGYFLVRAHRGNTEHMKEAAADLAGSDPPKDDPQSG